MNTNKWNQSTLFSRMIDFWKTDILTKWHIPYVTMVGRRQFNIPISLVQQVGRTPAPIY